MTEPNLRREWAMPSRWTFEINPIRELVEREMNDGMWIDPFAGKSDIADVTNDIHPERESDYSKDAVDFLRLFDENEVTGGVLFDPPYSATQLKRLYDDIGKEIDRDDTNGGFYGECRDEIARICAPSATVVSFGWSSVGIGRERGFNKREILMVCHGSSRNDTICVVEDYISQGATELTDFGIASYAESD